MKRNIIFLIAALMAVPAFAGNAAKPAKSNYIPQFDADKNGHMTEDERAAGRKTRFETMDADKNGKLTRDEFVKGHSDWRKNRDANADILVDLGEYVTFFCGEEPKAGDTAKHPDAKKNHIECVVHRHALFLAEDTNKDGKISEAEHKTAKDKDFARMDKNTDGLIELDEFYVYSMPCGKTEAKPGKHHKAKSCPKETETKK